MATYRMAQFIEYLYYICRMQGNTTTVQAENGV